MKRYEQVYDEFRRRVDSMPDERQKVHEIIEFALNYGDSYGDRVKPLMEEGIALSRKINFEIGEILCYFNILFFGGLVSGANFVDIESTLRKDSLVLVKKLEQDPLWYSLGLNQLSFYHWFRGDYENGFNLAFEAIKYTQLNEDKNSGWNYFSLGVFFFDTRDFGSSGIYYAESFRSF